MANTAAPGLATLTGAATAANDLYVVHDVSANLLKGQLPAEVAASLAAFGNFVLPSIVDVKGDLIVGTGVDVVGRLGAGVNDTVLTADATTGTGLKWQSPMLLPQAINAQVGTTYTLTATDIGKLVTLNNAAAVTLTVPQDSDATIPIGCYVELMQLGAGLVTVVAGTGATLRTTPTAKARSQYSRLFVQKIAANTWALAGDLSAT